MNLKEKKNQLLSKTFLIYKTMKFYARYKRLGFYGAIKTKNINHIFNSKIYLKWIKYNENTIFNTTKLKYSPLILIVGFGNYKTIKYLEEMLNSVLKQTYKKYEFYITCNSNTDKEVKKILSKYEKKYSSIKIIDIDTVKDVNYSIFSSLAEYVTFINKNDIFAPNALYEIVKKLNINKELKLVYTDEDKINKDGKRFNPHFKSSWNPDMFFSKNYISNMFLLKKEIFNIIHGFRKGYNGNEYYDLILRSLKHIGNAEIGSVQKILYHQHVFNEKESLKDNTSSGIQALKDYFNQFDNKVKVEKGLLVNTYKINYILPEKLPLVSLLIPTRDGYDILHKCIESILEKTLYDNYEIIILDNQTEDKKTLKYFDKLSTNDKISIIKYNYSFNYSAINNFGVRHAKGEIIGLINNDVEIISHNWLNEMVQHAIRPEIGAVGAKLYYSNDTIQHGGVIIGLSGSAGHSHKHYKVNSSGYFSRLKLIQNYSAVTAACLLVRKKLYNEVDGLNEKDLTVAFNDVDFCLKLQEKGYRNLWTPYSELYHHESISRGSEDTPHKKKRSRLEREYIQKNNKKVFGEGDLYYNKNLTLLYDNFAVKI